MAATLKRSVVLLVALVASALTVLAVHTTANAAPYSHALTCALSAGVVPRGGSLTVSGNGYTPGSTVDLAMSPRNISLGSATVKANGTFSAKVTIPSWVAVGPHTLTSTESSSGQSTSCNFRVTALSSTGGGGSGGSGNVGGGGSSGTLAFTGIAVMSIGALGVILLIGGGVMLLLGRRGKASS